MSDDRRRQELRSAYSAAISFLRSQHTVNLYRERGFYDAVRSRLREINGAAELGLPGELAEMDARRDRILASLSRAIAEVSLTDGL